jgi:hypothetical protein
MRQRRGAVVLEPAQSDGPVVETLKALDVYPKMLDDFKERTGSGAAVSIISVCSILLLIFSELRAYMTSVTTDHLYVDTTHGERIRINVNITFPNMPCAGLNLVAMDVAGEQQIDVVANVVKTRLSLDGRHRLGSELDEAGVARALGGKGGPNSGKGGSRRCTGRSIQCASMRRCCSTRRASRRSRRGVTSSASSR